MPKNTKSQPVFEARVEKWKSMDRTTRDAQNSALAFYDEYIFPLVKEAFISKLESPPRKKYDALILPVGFSPEPLILSILAIDPKRIGFLYTRETEKLLPRIQEETELTLDRITLYKIDGSNIVEVYEKIMELYNNWEHPTNIAVDITGGKKSMVSGVAMAGAVLGADIYYVDNHQFDRELGKPEPGSEYLSLLDNPYTVFGDLEVDKAKDLYKGHDYAGAKRIFDQLKQQVRDPNKATTYEAYGLLCATYEAWDNLDIGSAQESLDLLLKTLGRFSSRGLTPLRDDKPILVEQTEALKRLNDIFADEKRAFCIPDGFHFAFMLYHSALRREAQGKLDTACLLLYRLLEWIGQHRLAQYSIMTNKPDYSKSGMEKTELLDEYKKKRKAVYGSVSVLDLPNPIALVDGFLLLDALGDEIVNGLNWRAFRGQVEMRNRSVYAHGMSKITPKNFNAFKSTVEKRFEKAQKIADVDADAFNEQHKFIAPLP